MSAIEIYNITKTYNKGSIIALDDISLEVEKGEIFGLIGPDGAGKTSLFRILTTLLAPDSGVAKVMGYDTNHNYAEIRKDIGYMPGKFSLYQDLTVEENLNFFATLFNTTIEENYHLIKDIYIQLEPFKNRRAGKLSGGMKQKLALCCALIHEPEILFLDEPTTGVDPVSRKEFWSMLADLKKKNITILVSTPYMDEAALCDRIALIHKGKILDIDTPQGITGKGNQSIYIIKGPKLYHLQNEIRALEITHSCYSFGDELHWKTDKSAEETEKALYTIISENKKNYSLTKGTPVIEDIFIELMQRSE